VAAEFEAIEADLEARWRERTAELPGLWVKAGVEFTQVSDEENAKVLADDVQAPVIAAWREDMERAGLDADAVLETARGAVN
jgi:hypothetical protein